MLCPQSSEPMTLDPAAVLLLLPQSPGTASLLQPQDRKETGTTLSLQEHPRLFRLLHSESFRAELRARPVETLAEHGVHLDPADVPSHVVLPQPEGVADPVRWHALLG